MVKYDALIHDRKFFEPAHIKERQEQYKFTQAVKVETFLWDIESMANCSALFAIR